MPMVRSKGMFLKRVTEELQGGIGLEEGDQICV